MGSSVTCDFGNVYSLGNTRLDLTGGLRPEGDRSKRETSDSGHYGIEKGKDQTRGFFLALGCCYHSLGGGLLQVGLDRASVRFWASLGLPQGIVNNWDFVA
jgi:hypothetical protein